MRKKEKPLDDKLTKSQLFVLFVGGEGSRMKHSQHVEQVLEALKVKSTKPTTGAWKPSKSTLTGPV